jgi:hypothetical protein
MEDAQKIRVKLISQLETANCPNLSDEEKKYVGVFLIQLFLSSQSENYFRLSLLVEDLLDVNSLANFTV